MVDDPVTRAVRYVEVAPPAHLAPWVACAWSSRGVSAPTGHRVLPDGCIDVVIDVSSGVADVRIVGPMSTAAVVPIGGLVDVLGIRFRPGGHVLLAPFGADTLLDADADPRDLLPRARLRAALATTALIDAVPEQRLALLWPAFADAARHARARDPLLVDLLATWREPRAEPARVREIARDAGVSERTLERRVRAAAGFGPAELRRLVRFRRALRIRDAGVRDWAALAIDAGYSDQPHFAREFRRFAGLSPTVWDAERRRVGFVQDGVLSAL